MAEESEGLWPVYLKRYGKEFDPANNKGARALTLQERKGQMLAQPVTIPIQTHRVSSNPYRTDD